MVSMALPELPESPPSGHDCILAATGKQKAPCHLENGPHIVVTPNYYSIFAPPLLSTDLVGYPV